MVTLWTMTNFAPLSCNTETHPLGGMDYPQPKSCMGTLLKISFLPIVDHLHRSGNAKLKKLSSKLRSHSSLQLTTTMHMPTSWQTLKLVPMLLYKPPVPSCGTFTALSQTSHPTEDTMSKPLVVMC